MLRWLDKNLRPWLQYDLGKCNLVPFYKILFYTVHMLRQKKTAKNILYFLFFLVYFWAGVILLVCFCFSRKFLPPLDSPCILWAWVYGRVLAGDLSVCSNFVASLKISSYPGIRVKRLYNVFKFADLRKQEEILFPNRVVEAWNMVPGVVKRSKTVSSFKNVYAEGTERTRWKTPRLAYTVRKGYRFPCPHDVTKQTLSGQELLKYSWPGRQELLKYSWPGRVSLVTSWLGTGKTITFFTVERRKPAIGGTTSSILRDPTWVIGRKSTNIPYPSKR